MFFRLYNKIHFFRKIKICLCCFCILYFACAGTGRWANRIEWPDYKFESTPTQANYPDAEAILLLDEGKMIAHISTIQASSIFTQHKIIKILNRHGKQWADITIPYSSQTRVKNIKARTISPSGKITMLDKKRIFDINLYPNFIFYSDIRAKRFSMPAVENGCIIEYSYKKEINNVTYWNRWPFQHSIPTLISRYTLRIPSKWEYKVQSYQMHAKASISEKQVDGSKIEHIWEERNIPPFLPEVAMPAVSDIVKHLAFSPAFVSKWNDISNWFYNLTSERMLPNERIKSFTNKLISGKKYEKEILKRLFQFVRDNIRYVAIEIGIGGYQPHFASETFHNRYGDCKDMAALLIAMIDAAAMKAYPALVSTQLNGEVDTALASHNQFNHVIVNAVLSDSQVVWMDPTDKDCAFGELPWYDQGVEVFVVKNADEYEFIRTPFNEPNQNLYQTKWFAHLDSLGELKGKCRVTIHGVPAQLNRCNLGSMNPGLRKQWLENEIASNCPSASLDSFYISNLKTPQKPISIQIDFHAPNFASIDSNLVILEGSIFRRAQYEDIFTATDRKYSVIFNYLQKRKDFVTLTLPNGYKVIRAPKPEKISCEWADYEINYRFYENKLELFRFFQLKQQQVPKDDYINMRAFFQKIGSKERHKIIFENSHI